MSKVIVVGGGAAGMMAAYSASLGGADVLLLERNEKLGKKIYITGKGRCNVTNTCPDEEFFGNVVSNPKFLYSSIYGFDAARMMELLEKNGCPLKTERGGRVFPVSDHASDVTAALERLLRKQGVEIQKNVYVERILTKADADKANTKIAGVSAVSSGSRRKEIAADAVILAAGGKSYPSTGSDGSGYHLAEGCGHSLTQVRPGLVPLTVEEDHCGQLQGLSLKNVEIHLEQGGKEIYRGFGEMLFTHFGLSGPLVLSAASYWNKKPGQEEGILHLDLKPALPAEKLDKRILREFEENKNKQLKNVIINLLPGKLAALFPSICGIPEDKNVNSITREERECLLRTMKDMQFHVTGTRGFEEAVITMGGIRVKEINPSTMESKLVKGLYFAGEIMDVDALTGGFNLQIAWSTGYLAGQSCLERVDRQ